MEATDSLTLNWDNVVNVVVGEFLGFSIDFFDLRFIGPCWGMTYNISTFQS